MVTRATKKAETPTRRLVRRVAIGVAALAVGVFLVEGGEWGTVDLVRQRARYLRLQEQVKQLEQAVDSLRGEHKAVTSDPERLERVARERYGMVRGPKELLYRVRDPGDLDSTSSRTRAGGGPRD
jgi:cell division protein FtsB